MHKVSCRIVVTRVFMESESELLEENCWTLGPIDYNGEVGLRSDSDPETSMDCPHLSDPNNSPESSCDHPPWRTRSNSAPAVGQ